MFVELTASKILWELCVAGSSPARLIYWVLIQVSDAYMSEVAQWVEHDSGHVCGPYSNIISVR